MDNVNVLQMADEGNSNDPQSSDRSVSRQRQWQKRNPEKHKAQQAVHQAKQDGSLGAPDTCEKCGLETEKLEAHHPDYSKPLEVVWLCKSCHEKEPSWKQPVERSKETVRLIDETFDYSLEASGDSTARKLAVMPKPKKERKAKSRARGTGSLFERGRTYWFELHYGGERFRQSLNVPVTGKTVDRNLALDKMAEAVRAIRSGEAVKKFEPVTMRALYDAWMVKVETPGNNKPRTVADYKSRWTAHLEPVFGKLFASQITRDKVAEYKMQRGKEGAGVCTLNREIAVLQMIFNYNREKIPADRFPHFLRELKNVNRETHRQGRLSNADYKILQDRLADPKLFWLKALITLTFKFGFRKSELLNAKVGMFDPTGSVFVLPPYMTKNRKERRVPIARDGEIFKMLVTLTEGRNGEDALFTRNGKPVKDYRGEWKSRLRA